MWSRRASANIWSFPRALPVVYTVLKRFVAKMSEDDARPRAALLGRRREGRAPLLYYHEENGLVMVLREAIGADVLPPARKVTGTPGAALLAALEALLCWAEATCAFYICAYALRSAVFVLQGPRVGACEWDNSAPFEAVRCALLRDWPAVAAHAGAVAGMAAWSCWRFSGFFGMAGSDLIGRVWPKKAMSFEGYTAILCMAAGALFQVGIELLSNRGLWSTENFREANLGFSALRCAQLLLLIPLREEFVFRVWVLHIFRNRTPGKQAAVLTGAFFGLTHLANASSREFSWSFVRLQVFLSTLIGTLLGTRMLLEGRERGLLEPLMLHCINNLAACMLRFTADIDFSDTYNLASLTQTVLIFGYLVADDLDAVEDSDDVLPEPEARSRMREAIQRAVREAFARARPPREPPE
jgi:membrane protease YdiL (CAAX protease family)